LFRTFSNSNVIDKDNDSYNITFPSGVNLIERYEQGTPYIDTLSYLTTDDELNNHSGEYRLQDCDGNTSERCTCAVCGDLIDYDDSHTGPNGETLCENCFYDSYSYCNHCGDVFKSDELYNCDGDYYCEDCADREGYKKCDQCGEWHNEYFIVDDDCYCNDCYDKHCFYCEDCEEDIAFHLLLLYHLYEITLHILHIQYNP